MAGIPEAAVARVTPDLGVTENKLCRLTASVTGLPLSLISFLNGISAEPAIPARRSYDDGCS